MLNPAIQIDLDRLRSICRKYGVAELDVFGSATRDDFGPESDIDVLVEFTDRSKVTWDTYFDLKFELEELFGRHVDLVDGREAILNPIRRRVILQSLERLYAA